MAGGVVGVAGKGRGSAQLKNNKIHGKAREFLGMRRDGDNDDRKRMRHRSRGPHRFSRECIIEKVR